uniref:Uncharacterized protein n=1 Tax=Anguilla anguilla TaxID=7936 RepID=A0A0E9X100_ANGAN
MQGYKRQLKAIGSLVSGVRPEQRICSTQKYAKKSSLEDTSD